MVDFHPAPPGTAQGWFSVDGPGLRPVPASETPPTTEPTPPDGSPTVVRARASGPEAVLRDSLRRIYDPEIPINIVDLGLIYGIDWPEEGRVRIRMTMTSPGCPVTGVLQDEVKAAAERIEGIREAEVRVVWDPPWHPDRMSTEAKRRFGYT
jgi:metal-sulfur cluster biosynthetic enzyme